MSIAETETTKYIYIFLRQNENDNFNHERNVAENYYSLTFGLSMAEVLRCIYIISLFEYIILIFNVKDYLKERYLRSNFFLPVFAFSD